MISTLVLHRGALSAWPYRQWRRQDELILGLVSAEKLRAAGEHEDRIAQAFDHGWAIDPYDRPGALAEAFDRLRNSYRIGRIVALAERDMVRAARMRASLGLPGQTVESALHFTNKWIMKQRLQAAGVPVAAGAVVTNIDQVAAFAKTHGWPVILKPLSGTGSAGVCMAEDLAMAAALLAQESQAERQILIETFVEGRQYHVDGWLHDGVVQGIWPSAYINNPLAYRDERPVGGVLLSRDDPLAPRLASTVTQALAALPTPGAMAFHAELFLTPAGDLVMGEIASRPGGLQISDMLGVALGRDYREMIFDALCGAHEKRPSADFQPAGWIALPTRRARVLRIPPRCDLPFVASYQPAIAAGQTTGSPRHVNDHVAGFVVTGADSPSIERRLAQAEAWFNAMARFED